MNLDFLDEIADGNLSKEAREHILDIAGEFLPPEVAKFVPEAIISNEEAITALIEELRDIISSNISQSAVYVAPESVED